MLKIKELNEVFVEGQKIQTYFEVHGIAIVSDNFDRKGKNIDRKLMKEGKKEYTITYDVQTTDAIIRIPLTIKAVRGGSQSSKDECLLEQEFLGIKGWVSFNNVKNAKLISYIRNCLADKAEKHNNEISEKNTETIKKRKEDEVTQQGIKQIRKQIDDLKMDKQILETKIDIMDAELQNAKDDVEIARIKTEEAKRELSEVQTKMQNIFDTINDKKTYTSLGQQITKLTKTLEKKGYAQKVIDKAVADAVQKWTKKSLQF